jgi:hypothetical protein
LKAQFNETTDVYLFPQIPSNFYLGEDSIHIFVNENFNICKNNIGESISILTFIIEPNGSTSRVIFRKETNQELENNILEMLTKLPPWIPGTNDGKPVRSHRALVLFCEDSKFKLPPFDEK